MLVSAKMIQGEPHIQYGKRQPWIVITAEQYEKFLQLAADMYSISSK